jgi:Uncharacterized protein conserved in bacteria (DUF2252)
VDAARKVVGVGSVGTRCYVVLLLGDRDDDPLLLQIKQATTSVLEPYAGRSRHRHHGRRVVNGQRLLQTASDIFLGWTGDAVAISGYLGSSDRFDRAVASFAEAYADQSEADYAAFRRARGSPAGDGGRGGSANQRKGAEG